MKLVGRRAFLCGAGGFTLALPFLPSLFGRAEAEGGTLPRFVAVMSINGQFEANWRPDTTGGAFVDDSVLVKPLSEIAGPISPVLGSSFDDLRGKISVLMGLDGLSEFGHNRCFPLTASTHSEGGMERDSAPFFPYSVDAVLEHSAAFYPDVPPVGAVRLSPMQRRRSATGQSFSWWTEGGVTTRIPHQWDAEVVFNTLFGGAEPTATGVDPRERRSLVIDRVKEDFDRVRDRSRLGIEDRRRLDAFVDHLRDLQTRMARASEITCDGPTIHAGATDMDVIYADHVDLMVAALACGLTRVGTLFIRHCQSDGEEAGFHGNSHLSGPEAEAKSLVFNRWIAERVSHLLHRMDAFVEADGSTLLDHSAVLWSNEISMFSSHYQLDMPTLIAGGAGGRLRVGDVVDYRQPEATWTGSGPALGRPYNQLLTTIMSAMGLTQEDWELGGRPGFGDYRLIDHEYARNGGWERFRGRERDLLPHVLVG